MQTLIRAKWLIDGTGAPPLRDAGVLVQEDGRIAAAGALAAMPLPAERHEIDLGERTAMPGMIDCHVHLFGTPQPGGFFNTQFETEEWLLLRAAANARAALAIGLTTLRDCGGRGTLITTLAKAVASGLAAGPRILSSGMPITTTGGHCYYLGLEADGVDGVKQAVRRMHKSGVDFIKVMVTGGGITPGSNSRAAQYSQAELDAIVEDAHRLGKRVAGHVHGTQGIRRAVKAGFDTLEHASWLALDAEGRDYDCEVVDQILKKGIYVCRSIAGFERVPLEQATPQHKFWPDYAMLRSMARDGVMLAAGTDSGIDHTPITGYVTTLETMAGLGEMSSAAVLASATRVAAEAIGWADQVGTLTPGKHADLVAFVGNPFDDLRVLRGIDRVFLDGRLAAVDGKVIL
jgi:imidazolonepropionase-like amidohydrolase